ncbi:MAG: thermonuclease family protein [Planctomycetes bacterium]|nr:thermonuclease family protein [Planctomycetota bacterium]
MFWIYCAGSGSLRAELVEVLKIIDGHTLIVRESPEARGELAKEVLSGLTGQVLKTGAIRLAGIKIEPGDPRLFSENELSEYGMNAMEYIKAKVILQGRWHYELDSRDEEIEGGVGLGYLIDDTGRNLNAELIREGYSPYYFKDGFAKKYHMEMVGAERLAFHARRGIWEYTERRSDYFFRRKKWARAIGAKGAPSLAYGDKVVTDVGENPELRYVFIGVIILLAAFLLDGKRISQRIGSGEYFRKSWIYGPLLKIPLIRHITASIISPIETYFKKRCSQLGWESITDSKEPALNMISPEDLAAQKRALAIYRNL